jgi:hypothetical protein
MENKKIRLGKTHLRLAYFLLPVIGMLSFIPGLALYVVNRLLGKMEGYRGSVKDVTVTSMGKVITVSGFELSNDLHSQLVSVDLFQLGIDRKLLRKGALNMEVVIIGVDASFTKTGHDNPASFDFSGVETPVIFTNITIKDVALAYMDPDNTPALDIHINDLQVLASNLSASRITSNVLPTDIMITAKLLEGVLTAHVKANLLQQDPSFDINAEVRNINLVLLNDFLKRFGHFDVNRGTLCLFAEVAAKDNKFTGYIKPEVFDLDIVGPEDSNKTLLNKVWQHVLGAAFFIFKNHIENEIATKIPVSGTFKNPHANIFVAIGEVFGNAFGKALTPSIDHEVNINSVKS